MWLRTSHNNKLNQNNNNVNDNCANITADGAARCAPSPVVSL